MAILSLPTNTPATDGAVIGCTNNDTTGTAYAIARTDRQWYFEVSADPLVTQAMIDADKAIIIAQDITASELVWAGTDVDLSSIELTVTGLADNAGPFYVGWVQETVDTTPPVISGISSGTPTSTAATIVWTTDKPATSSVEYGETAGLGTTEPATPDATLRTSHSIALSGLTSDTLYYYDVTSVDASANSATESGTPFTTAAGGYGDALVIEYIIPSDNYTLTIPGGNTTGFNFNIDYGDGQSDTGLTTQGTTHQYASAGTVEVSITGAYPWFYLNDANDDTLISKILNHGNVGTTNCEKMFRGAENCLEVAPITNSYATVTDFRSFMARFYSLENAPDLSAMDTTAAVNMDYMFWNWTAIVTSPDLSNVNTANVISTEGMFANWTSCTTAPDVGGWDMSKCVKVSSMFASWTASQASGMDPKIDEWSDISKIQYWGSFLSNSKLTTACYDRVCAAWKDKVMDNRENVNMGLSKFSAAAAADHSALEAVVDHGSGYLLIDGGQE